MKRTTIAVVLTFALTATACRDMGLEGNIPLDQAEHAPPKPLVQQVMERQEAGPRLIVDGRIWVPAGRPTDVDVEQLQPVGSGDGHTVYARSWDRPPFDALFIQLQQQPDVMSDDGGWQELAPVRGRTGPLPAADDPAATTGREGAEAH